MKEKERGPGFYVGKENSGGNIPRPGFHIVFANGNTVSVQFGPGNYCANQDYSWPPVTKDSCPNAEIAAWTAEGVWYDFDCDQVKGHCPPDIVADFIQFVATSDLTRDRWNGDPTCDGCGFYVHNCACGEKDE